jgi:aspartate racemase
MVLSDAKRNELTPIVGVLGGMGPAATVDFYSKLITATPASTDQDHLRIMIWADPSVPDRSKAIAGTGTDPVPALIHGVQKLKDAGAAFYVVTCNGAHAFLPEVRQKVDLDYLSMIDVTTEHISTSKDAKTVGILATDATLTAALYQDSLIQVGLTPIVPRPEEQRTVMEAIYGVKAGALSIAQESALSDVARSLGHRGADVIIAGCTEIPLALKPEASPRPLIDPSSLLAHRVVSEVAALGTDEVLKWSR